MTTRTPTETDALRRRVEALRWHHRIDLGGGVVTPGQDRSDEKLAALRLPSLEGRSVLDVGAWDGYFSFAAERLGARRVMAVDSFVWGEVSWGSQASFQLAREVLGSRVEDRYLEVLDVTPETVDGVWDVVLFLGVLYHLPDPFLALRRMAAVTGELLVVETLSDRLPTRRPAMSFYPGASMDNDTTNWWAPNEAALVAMLRELGFPSVEVVGRRSPAGKLGHLARNAANIAHSRVVRSRSPLGLNYLTTDRLIVHARR
jgi:tRNA (mo5U34)-methyltransferase